MNKEVLFSKVKVTALNREELFTEASSTKHVVTLNADIISMAHEIPRFLDIVNQSSSTIDGRIPELLLKRRYPEVSFEKISGSDLIYDIIDICKRHGQKIYLLGGDAKTNAQAVRVIQEKFGVECSGYSPKKAPYPFISTEMNTIKQNIQSFAPDYIFVGFGAPKQEYWINDHLSFLSELKVKMAVGCGGTFDFVAGTRARAPKIIQQLGLESVFRLIVEPKLFRVLRIFKSFRIFKYYFK